MYQPATTGWTRKYIIELTRRADLSFLSVRFWESGIWQRHALNGVFLHSPLLRATYRFITWGQSLTHLVRVVIAYIYTFYLLSFFFDLSPSARTKDQVELRQRWKSERGGGRGRGHGRGSLQMP